MSKSVLRGLVAAGAFLIAATVLAVESGADATGVPHVLRNISARARVETGTNPVITGFIIRGDLPKRVILRAVGPSLNVSGTPVPGRMADPTMQLFAAGNPTPIRTNDNWRDSQEAAIADTRLAPANAFEAAITETLAPGNYTAVVRDRNGGSGLVVVELYELDNLLTPKLANLSARAGVGANENVLIGGVIVGGSAGASSVNVVLRAIGPSLRAAGVPNVLADPTLELVDTNGTRIAFNDNWEDDVVLELQKTGLIPNDRLEAAILAQLGAGSYTAIVRGKGNSTGTALVEVYDVPPTEPIP